MVLDSETQLAEKEKYARQAVTLREQLAAQFPDVPEYTEKVATSTGLLVFVLHVMGRHQEEEKVSRQALEMHRKLADQFPDVPDHQSRLGPASTTWHSYLNTRAIQMKSSAS